jgi:hypothetical protein
MNKKFKLLSLLIFFSFTTVFAQTNSSWTPIGLSVNGKNIQNNVEAFYKLDKCNNEDVIFIKFINYNANSVTINWEDAIFTQNRKWINNVNMDGKKSLKIEANEVAVGECLSSIYPQLVIKVNDFIENIEDFKLFITNSFQVTNNKE